MLKLLLAAAAFCICMAAGRVAAEKFKLRQKTLCGFLSDLKVLEAALKYERTDVKSLALLLAARGSLREFWRIMSDELTNGAGFGEAWRRHLKTQVLLIKRCRLPRIIRRIFAPVCIFKPVHGLPDISLIHKHGFPLAVRMPALSAVQTEFRPLAIQRLAASLAHRFLGKPYSIRAPSARDTFRHRHAVADRTSRRIDEANDRLRHPPQSASCFFFSCCKISLHCISRSPPGHLIPLYPSMSAPFLP